MVDLMPLIVMALIDLACMIIAWAKPSKTKSVQQTQDASVA